MTRSASGALPAYDWTLPVSTHSSRSMPSHQKCESRAVSLTTSLPGSPETPDWLETASTVQTLNSLRFEAYGSTLEICAHFALASAWKSFCWARV